MISVYRPSQSQDPWLHFPFPFQNMCRPVRSSLAPCYSVLTSVGLADVGVGGGKCLGCNVTSRLVIFIFIPCYGRLALDGDGDGDGIVPLIRLRYVGGMLQAVVNQIRLLIPQAVSLTTLVSRFRSLSFFLSVCLSTVTLGLTS